jgi:hypothetical protein
MYVLVQSCNSIEVKSSFDRPVFWVGIVQFGVVTDCNVSGLETPLQSTL